MQAKFGTTAYKQHAKGFSLVEVLVSLSIFTIVVVISISTLLVLIDANTKSQSMQVVMSNLSFALDSMTREIRTGDSYFCILSSADFNTTLEGSDQQDCANGSSAFAFNEGGTSITGMVCSGAGCSRRIAYRLNGATIERRLGEDPDWVPVTSPDVSVEELRFVVTGSERGDDLTPTVTVFLSGWVNTGASTGSEFEIQTTVTQILLDV